jgi:hypothetical protein
VDASNQSDPNLAFSSTNETTSVDSRIANLRIFALFVDLVTTVGPPATIVISVLIIQKGVVFA